MAKKYSVEPCPREIEDSGWVGEVESSSEGCRVPIICFSICFTTKLWCSLKQG